MTDDEIIDGILKREGGFVDRPEDKGGPTNYGITVGTLAAWRRTAVTAADVQQLSVAEARTIYSARYISPFDKVHDEPLKDLLVDCAVNHGVQRAIQWLQSVLSVPADGVIGPVTIEALEQAYSWAVYYSVLAERIRFYGSLISGDHTQAVFAAGWMNRAAEFVERA